jgi:acyl-CoA reductase-like NAD-dependent aldehyde dehydrogenase
MSSRSSLSSTYPYFLGGGADSGSSDLAVTDKFTGDVCTRVALAGPEEIDRAIGKAVEAAGACRKMPSHARAGVLHHVVRRLGERSEEFSRVLALEAGKPIRDSRGEVSRAIDTFRIAAEESTRMTGEYMPLDISPRADGCEAIWKRVPVGVCSFITPFNFPLNLAAHKIAPAIAAGCPWVLKPASQTPISALLLGEILAETQWPRGAFSILPCRREAADLFTTDERIKLLSFTGSAEVGWGLKAKAGKKKVVLELGGNAACVVDRDADLEFVVSRLVIGTFYQSGQSCISVQRIMIHRSIYGPLKAKLVNAASKLKSGDPLEEDTFLGPLITEGDAKRIEQWVARRPLGVAQNYFAGHATPFFEATLMENVPDDLPSPARSLCPIAVGAV